MHLDIFDDSRDVRLRNDLVEALLRGEAAGVDAARVALAAEFPMDATLRPSESLVRALEARTGIAFTRHEYLAAARTAMADSGRCCRSARNCEMRARRFMRGMWRSGEG
jgi:hypothetical protein